VAVEWPVLLMMPTTFFIKLNSTYTENKRGPKYRPEVLPGLDFGIEVPTTWWEKAKEACAPVVRVDKSSPEGLLSLPTVCLTLATLPLSEFAFYRRGDEGDYRHLLLTRARRDENRRTFGWTAEERSSKGPESIQHRYVRVDHQLI
jgi:hypothetical protein